MPVNDFSHHQLTWYPDKGKLQRPIYKSLLEQLKVAINNGDLTPGTKLPPQRELADFLDINFTTITRTYKLSAQLGLTFGIHGKGTFVSPNGIDPLTANSRQRHTIDLGFAASFEQTNHLLDQVIKKTVKQGATQLLTYDSPTGREVDKLAFKSYLRWLGVELHTNQEVLVTAGGENSLTLLLMIIFSRGDKIAVDEFTYGNLIATAQLNNIQLVAIKNDQYGMDPTDLERKCQNNNLTGLYLMPEYSNPMGITLNTTRRNELAIVAKKNHLKVIEDDYLSFLSRNNHERPPKLMQLLPDQTFYICSMSKVLASGLRIGYLAFPQAYKQQIENGFFNTVVKVSSLNSAIATEAINSQTIYKIIDHKMSLAKESNKLFDSIFTDAPKTNLTDIAFFRRLPIKKKISGQQIERGLADISIRCFSSDRFKINASATGTFLRVSLSATSSLNELAYGLEKLKGYLESQKLIQKELAQSESDLALGQLCLFLFRRLSLNQMGSNNRLTRVICWMSKSLSHYINSCMGHLISSDMNC